VQEYYIYAPDRNELTGLERVEGELTVIEQVSDWISPRLGIRFVLNQDTLRVYYPDGQPFLATVELRQQAEQEKLRAEEEKLRADQEKLRADQEKLRAERLAEQLRSLGIEPNEGNL
jgi:hypothetical protein